MKKLLVFTVDNNYLPHLAVALISFLEFHKPDAFEIGLLYSDITDEELEKFMSFFYPTGIKIHPHIIANEFTGISVGYHFNPVIFYRLLAPEFFFEHDRILYLDSDIVFVENISELFDFDLKGKLLGAIDRTPFFGIPPHLAGLVERYLASGLLLIDVKSFLASEVKEKCIEFLKTHSYEMPDQDALSYAVQEFTSIDPSYSVETAFLEHSGSAFNFAKNPKIIQFSGSSKPWHLSDKHPYKKVYWKYRNQTPYRTLLSDDFGLISLIRPSIPAFLRKYLKEISGILKK